jgi:2-polyprenyl-3-methyl-5-hydroxy-6-metoxy-1,4-benzoquinol methylase
VRYGTHAVELPEEERARYDIVTLLDVIEHLPDPQVFVESIVAAFPRLSLLIVTVPARKELWSNYDEYFGHHQRYDLDMLRDLATSSNLRIAKAAYFFHGLYVPARMMAAMHRPRATRVDPPRGMLRFVHGALSAAMMLDYYCVPGGVPGTSAIARMEVRRSSG